MRRSPKLLSGGSEQVVGTLGARLTKMSGNSFLQFVTVSSLRESHMVHFLPATGAGGVTGRSRSTAAASVWCNLSMA